jgi:ribose-phosphate pyrophosphokinase
MSTGHKNLNYHQLMIFSLHHDLRFAQGIADILEGKMQKENPFPGRIVTLGQTNHVVFGDGDFKTHQKQSVADADVYIIARCRKGEALRSKDLLETMQLAFSLKQGRANRVTVIFPQMPYTRQDKEKEEREVILFPWLVGILQASGINYITTFEIHNKATVGKDPWGIKNMQTQDFLRQHIRRELNLDWSKVKFVAPDTNAAGYVKDFADHFGSEIVIVNKRRASDGKSEALQIVGDINGYDALIVDDIFDSCGTIVGAAEKMLEAGAHKLYVAGTHFVLTRDWEKNLKRGLFEKIIATDTCIIPSELLKISGVKVLSVKKMIAGVIDNLHNGKSITEFSKVVGNEHE